MADKPKTVDELQDEVLALQAELLTTQQNYEVLRRNCDAMCTKNNQLGVQKYPAEDGK